MIELYANCWVGEFGWELFCWHGYLRKLSKKHSKTTVVCRKGNERLYEDFATIISIELNCTECDMWVCKGCAVPNIKDIINVPRNSKVISPPALRYDHTHKLNRNAIFARFKEQEFVKLGRPTNNEYDVLFHLRSKSNRVNLNMNSSYRNWSIEKWKELQDLLKGKRIACIGTKTEALHLEGTDDLRGMPLGGLCDVMASSKLLVSPSSGPVHLAALCGLQHVTWYGHPYDKSNDIRYKVDWNPFRVKCHTIHDDKWNPSVESIVKSISGIL